MWFKNYYIYHSPSFWCILGYQTKYLGTWDEPVMKPFPHAFNVRGLNFYAFFTIFLNARYFPIFLSGRFYSWFASSPVYFNFDFVVRLLLWFLFLTERHIWCHIDKVFIHFFQLRIQIKYSHKSDVLISSMETDELLCCASEFSYSQMYQLVLDCNVCVGTKSSHGRCFLIMKHEQNSFACNKRFELFLCKLLHWIQCLFA